MKNTLIGLTVFVFVTNTTSSQVVLNEVASTNVELIQDQDGDFPDWIELYNPTASTVNLLGWGLTDNSTWNKWQFPDLPLAAGSRLLVFASGKNLNAYDPNPGPTTDHWETALFDNDSWQYKIGNSAPPVNWNSDLVNSSGWPSGTGGFGYGDGDDNTTVPNGTYSVYFRKTFTMTNVADMVEAILSIDYDDSFIAYINGVEIARNGLTDNPAWNTLSDIDHEAAMYGGGNPETFAVDNPTLQSLILPGTNVLAVEVHNISTGSSDLTGRAWLHFGIGSASVYFSPNPSFFVPPIPGGNGNELHTNFKISFGETVRLYNNLSVLQDNSLANEQVGHAHARIGDGGTWCYTNAPTPNAVNTGTCYSGYALPPTISPASGFYPSTVSVTMTGGQVRYTTNGDVPDATDPLYASAFNVTSTDVVRAVAFEVGKLPSAAVTRTYFINDPTTLPVVSIVAHSGDLFNDGTGGPAVYDNSQGFVQASTTGCTIQYYDAAHNFQFESNASLTPVGNYSLDFAQKSMQFQYDEEYGASSDIAYNVFSHDKPGLGASHGFRVRNMDDDWGLTRLRDLLVNRMALPTHSGTAAYQNMAVFINGEYWGHYSGREMLNSYFMRDNYGPNSETVNTVKTAYPAGGYVADDGSDISFLEMSDYIINTDMSVQANFDQAQTLVDTDNWVDYWANEIYNDNQDWYASCYFNNTRLANSDIDNMKWKYILWDVSYTMGIGGGPWDNLLYTSLASPCYANRHTDMMSSLLDNAGFENYFINRFADLLNWHWTYDNLNSIITECAEEMEPEIDRQNATWGSGDVNYWNGAIDDVRWFHQQRPSIQRDQIENYFGLTSQVNITLNVSPANAGYVKISTVTPDVYPWTGVYFNGNPVTVTAIAKPGYTFVNWNANAFISNLTNATFTNNVTGNTTFTANFSGSAIAANIIVTEINYNSDSTRVDGDWIELYNNTNVAINISDWKFRDANFYNEYSIPTGTIIPSHGYLVLSEDLVKFSEEHPSVANVLGEFSFDLSNGGEMITVSDIMGNAIINFAYDDATGWPCTPDGHGRTLELKTFASNPTLAASWFEGCMGGSPGAAFGACNENPVVSEINYKSSVNSNAGDWIELHNKSGSAIGLDGWKIGDMVGNIYTIPNGTALPANGYLVLYQDLILFNTQFPAVTNKVGPFVFGFSGDGDVIRISDSTGRLVESICYNDTAPWPLSADGGGYTLEIFNENGNLNDGANWFEGCPKGSPGVAYNPQCITVCQGDFDGNGLVNVSDLLLFMGNYGCVASCGLFDVDGNGSVNTNDLLLFLAFFGVFC